MSGQAAGGVNIVLNLNKASYTANLKEAQRQLDQFTGKSKAAGHATVSSMQAASASIRLLENPLGNNIRAIERLITTIPGVGAALKIAFPLVGGFALASMFVDLGIKAADFVKKANAIPNALTQGFRAMHAAAQLSNDELRLTNDRLQNEINKLQGKPQNNLAISIDETRIAADKLSDSLANDAKRVKDLLEQNKVTLTQQIFLGKGSTADVTGSVNSYRSQLADLGYQQDVATHNGDTAGAASLRDQIHAKEQSYLKWLNDQVKTRTGTVQGGVGVGPIAYSKINGNQDANLGILRGEQTSIYDRQDQQAEEARNPGLEAQKAKLEADKEAARLAKEAARQALEAQKKAAAEQLQQLESDNANWKAEQTRSVGEDAAWWINRATVLNVGATNYREIMRKVDADLIDQHREYSESIKKVTTEYLTEFDKTGGLSIGDNKQLDDSGKAAAAYITSLRASIDLNKANSDAIAESSIAMAVATGQMTKLDAAQAMAALHTQMYSEALAKLQDQRNAADPTLTPQQTQARNADLDNQITGLNDQRARQVQQDSQATNPVASSGLVGFENALDEFVDSTRDAAKSMQEITKNALTSINGELTKAITGQRTSFGGTFKGIGDDLVNKGLQSAEGGILGAFGFGGGKAGSKGNPVYVRLADGIGGVAGSATSSLSSVFKGGGLSSLFKSGDSSSSSDGSSTGSSIGGLFSKLVGLLPHFAGGGSISSNMLSVVGENGPELFNPSTSGTIIPNHQISVGGGGGGDTHNYHIDARGSTDPAATRAAVQQGIQRSVEISAQQRHQQSIRRPSHS